MSGAVSPFSHLLTACAVTEHDSASCSCVIPRALRSAAILSPKLCIENSFYLLSKSYRFYPRVSSDKTLNSYPFG